MNYEIPGHLEVKKGHLHIGGVDTVELAKQYGTPLYVTNEDRLRDNYRRFSKAFKQKMSKVYQARRDALLVGLKALGIRMEAPKATFYVWTPVPGGNSVEYAKFLLDRAGVVCTPGIGLGKYGEGYVRFSLTRPVERINEAVERMKKI